MTSDPPDSITVVGVMPRTKTACRSAYITPVTLSGVQAGTSHDGLTLAAGDRVAFLAQATGSENGIYTIRTGLAPVRATDMDAAGELVFGDMFQVTAGTVLAGTWFQCVTTGTITIGTTATVWVEATDGISVSGVLMDNTAPTASTVTGVTMSNTAPTAATVTGVTMSNTAPTAATVTGVTMSNTAPSATTVTGVTMSNTAPEQMVIDGETEPVSGVTPPTPPTVVSHTHTLVAGEHYIVQVGSRSAGVTIDLPPSPTTGQHVSIVDTSGQAPTYHIVVDGDAKALITSGGATTYTISDAYVVLALYYTGVYWKII